MQPSLWNFINHGWVGRPNAGHDQQQQHAIGGAKFSEQHANFIINFNAATFADVTGLINLARERVLEQFGTELKTEVVIL